MTDPTAIAVDVLIAAWNRSDTIDRAVSSALSQPEVRAVIVVDDGSTDDTAIQAVRAGTGGGRVIVRRLPSNVGPSAARNHGLEASTAPWIAILDADDYLLPGRLGKMLSFADGLDFVADDILGVASSRIGKEDPQPIMFDRHFEPWRLDFAAFVLGNRSSHRPHAELGYFKPLMRRAFLDRHQLRYDDRLRLGEDYALYARALALRARFLVTPALGYVSVLRSDSLSARHTREDLERHRDVDLELGEIKGLSGSDRRALRKHYRSMDARVQWAVMVEAFKARAPVRFLSPFARSPEVSLFVLRMLGREVYRRLLNPAARARERQLMSDRR